MECPGCALSLNLSSYVKAIATSHQCEGSGSIMTIHHTSCNSGQTISHLSTMFVFTHFCLQCLFTQNLKAPHRRGQHTILDKISHTLVK